MFKIQVIDVDSGDWVDLYLGFETEQGANDYMFGLRMLVGNRGKQYRVVAQN